MARDTSIEAFNKIRDNGLLSKRRMQVYEYLFEHGPCTAKQVTGNLRQGLQDSGGYNTRLSELRRMGVVKEVDKIVCPESGQKVILWDVTSNMPTEIHKDELAQKLAELGFDSLDEYYESDHWQNFKRGYYSRHPRICAITGRIDNIHLHHIIYDNLGCERDEDVIPIHGEMHELLHRLVKEHKVPLNKAHLVLQETVKPKARMSLEDKQELLTYLRNEGSPQKRMMVAYRFIDKQGMLKGLLEFVRVQSME